LIRDEENATKSMTRVVSRSLGETHCIRRRVKWEDLMSGIGEPAGTTFLGGRKGKNQLFKDERVGDS